MAFQYGKDIGTHSYNQIVAFARRSGVPFSVSSTYRPGAVTLSGHTSYHAMGNAADLTSSAGNMQTLAAWCERFAPYILELIHSGGKGYFVHNGKIVPASFYGAAIIAQHYNHVHLAMTLSGIAAAQGSGGGITLVSADTTAEGNTGCLTQLATATTSVTGLAILAWELVSHFH